MQDQQGGPGLYPTRVTASAEELARLGELPLIPGMLVEVFAETGGRTVLSYLVKPLRDQISKAFREE